eukprot:3424407-Pleurochrysis_carterae.AAC.2
MKTTRTAPLGTGAFEAAARELPRELIRHANAPSTRRAKRHAHSARKGKNLPVEAWFGTVFPYLPKNCPPPPPMRARARAKNQVCAYAIRSIERVRVSTRVRSQSRTHIAGACFGFRI